MHISVGDIFRWNVQNHTKMGAQVRAIMASGELVGDDLAESVVRDSAFRHDWNYGFIIDGSPRNRRQAEFFLESYDMNSVIVLDLPLTAKFAAGCSTAGCAATAAWTTT